MIHAGEAASLTLEKLMELRVLRACRHDGSCSPGCADWALATIEEAVYEAARSSSLVPDGSGFVTVEDAILGRFGLDRRDMPVNPEAERCERTGRERP